MIPEQVAQLKRDLFINKKKVKDIQKKYKISLTHISRIARGESWPHILPELTRKVIIQNNTSEKTVKKIVAELSKNKKNKLQQKDIADKYDVSEYVVSRIKKKHF